MNEQSSPANLPPAENPKFREICELYDKPDFLRNAFVKYMGESCHVMKFKPKWLNPKFAEAISKVRPPFGWRREILMAWRKTVLKKHIQRQKSKDSPYRIFGRSIGSLENLSSTAEKLACPDDDALWYAIFEPFIDIPDEIKIEIEATSEKQLQTIEHTRQLVMALPAQQQVEFWAGYAEGLPGLFTEKLGFTDATDSTKIYHLLLMLGDLVRRFDTVGELYEFCKFRLKHEMPHTLEAFQKICNRLGIRGATYSSSKRRRKSMDKRKQARLVRVQP